MATEPSRADRASQQAASSVRSIWVAVMVLAATIIACAAGFLAYLSGANPPASILAGGGAFGSSTLLFLAIAHYTDGGRR
ncbi:hypothetical protein ACQP2F_20790 [Actinoplanes sp. CA-030573]|uniref:hypothetical protein n=1 Tax=Actinoplanes sp. CA-030573 TaxID=3239898 RepID=UPI003D935EA5